MVRHSLTSLKLQSEGSFLKEKRKMVNFNLVFRTKELLTSNKKYCFSFFQAFCLEEKHKSQKNSERNL